MKKYSLLLFLSIFFSASVSGQVICLFCFDQNSPISSNSTNLIQNGGFEDPGCLAQVYCPLSTSYVCDVANWTCTGGGTSTYGSVVNSASTVIVEGANAIYLGNFFCNPCSPTVDDISCVNTTDCIVTGIPSGYPVNTPEFGGTTGLSIQQTVSGLVPGNIYVLEFWAGGESGGLFLQKGVFGLDVGFGPMVLSNKPTNAGSADIGSRYIVEFRAISSSHIIKFTNWGHICSTCTELMLDDVNLYPQSELSSTVPYCDPGSSLFAIEDSLHIPNVFTPNNQGPNDFFTVYYTGSKTYDITIYNRWGESVFKSNDKTKHWNGKINDREASDGTYYYVLSIGTEKYAGFLTLLR